MKLLRWLWAYALLFAGTVGVAIALSWLLGTDVKAWAIAHRPLTIAVVALSIVIFMIYKFLEDIEDR